MSTDFGPIIAAAVHQAKARQSLIWADLLARRIADSTPLPAQRAEIAEQVMREAVRQGAPLKLARKRYDARAG
jgi:hypothetical protein